jgi:hypothetical protein
MFHHYPFEKSGRVSLDSKARHKLWLQLIFSRSHSPNHIAAIQDSDITVRMIKYILVLIKIGNINTQRPFHIFSRKTFPIFVKASSREI